MTKAGNPFVLPEWAGSGGRDASFEPKRFRLWIENLPTGNVGQTAQELYRQLREMCAVEMPVADRLQNLEMLLEVLSYVMDSLRSSYAQESTPLGRRSQLLAELNDSLNLLTIHSYKAVLDQYHSESLAARLLHKGSRALALYRVLFFLGRSLLNAYQLYRPAPQFLWREIHGIHHYAARNHLEKRRLETDEGVVTVEDLYKQLLLLSLSGPYRLLHGEVSHVYLALGRWSKECRLLKLDSSHQDKGAYVVDIAGDAPPSFQGGKGDVEVKEGWVLDAGCLAAKLADELESLEIQTGATRPQTEPDAISPDLLARLMLTWGVGTRRVVDRVESQGELMLTYGFEVLYRLFGGVDMPEFYSLGMEVASVNPADQLLTVRGVIRDEPGADEFIVEGGPDMRDIARSIDNGTMLLEDDLGAGIEEEVSHSRLCSVIDESSSGCHLVWTGEGDSGIHVGELVAIRRPADEESEVESPVMGVVRWMKLEAHGHLSFGVELFDGDIEPVIFRRQIRGQGRKESWRGFVNRIGGKGEMLITPPFYTDGNDRGELVQGDRVTRVEVSRVLEATPSFIQLYFRNAERPEQNPKAVVAAKGDEEMGSASERL